MKIECAPPGHIYTGSSDLDVVLYGIPTSAGQGWIGASIEAVLKEYKIVPSPFAWDFLSFALSVIAADRSEYKENSPDGWTRKFDLTISVGDPRLWNQLKPTFEKALRFLTTDIWNLSFVSGGYQPTHGRYIIPPPENSVLLLSGGLDSAVGAIDAITRGFTPLLVSQTPPEGKRGQIAIKDAINPDIRHLQLNFYAQIPNAETPPKQRARSIIFLAYGIIAASNIASYYQSQKINLFVCENGFISLNPPLSENRIGSLSTRTTHPVFLTLLQYILDNAGTNIQITNPYKYKTKGEMLSECMNQGILQSVASSTVSCGKFSRWGHRHCGRCVPCIVRRSAFNAWGYTDDTNYACDNLSLPENVNSEDVRAALMAIAKLEMLGVDKIIGASLSSPLIPDVDILKNVAQRGLIEIKQLFARHGIL